MANLQKIKDLSKEKNISIKSIAETIGVSEQGLHKMIREETMSVVVLEQIARILSADICLFFDIDVALHQTEHYEAKGERGIAARKVGKVDNRNATSSGQQIIELQKELLEAKNQIINLLQK